MRLGLSEAPPVPVAFDCYLTRRQSRVAVVTYDGCFVDTSGGAMNRNTGIFKVAVPGIYQVQGTHFKGTSPKRPSCTTVL